MIIGGLIIGIGVLAAIAAILSLSVLAEQWLAPPPAPSEPYEDRPLVRVIKPGAGRVRGQRPRAA
jgi:hypothetical protein